MVDVVIFGTGSAGERAWRAAASTPGINVVCFADNDTRKHGTLLHDRSIVGASDLDLVQWEQVVLATVYRADVRRQLIAQGIAASRIVSPDPNLFDTVFASIATGAHLTPARKEGLVRLNGSERASSAHLHEVFSDRIHYACGRNVLDGWLNVDGYDESFPCGEIPGDIAGRIFRLDLTGPHPFPSNAFRLGYSEDFVEHITQQEFIAFLCEAYRTFQPGGVLRLSSPGLEGALRRHLRGSDWQAADVLRDEAYERWWHKHFLCFDEVDAIARHIGWGEVRELPYGESSIADLRQDTRPSQADLNLVVELVK